ncbi:MAG: prepilin-type N-terminal cleavage/methylation domain-containing protein, partial [Myxococcota bacterium]
MKRGFTLLEVMIALLILAVSLAVLLQAQAGSLANSSRARDMTVATLLARSKMIDIEQVVFDEGFV